MAERRDVGAKGRKKVHESLDRIAKRLENSRRVKPGDIVFRLAGPAGGNYSLECSSGQVRVVESVAAGTERAPVIEVIGDAETVRAIIDGETDARKKFLAGGLRVRGDLRYLSDIALELEVLKEPL